MKKALIVCCFCLIALVGSATAQSVAGNNIAQNKVLMEQLQGYNAYVKDVVIKYKIEEYLIVLHHKKNGKRDSFTFSTAFYPVAFGKPEPTGVFKSNGSSVLVYDETWPIKWDDELLDGVNRLCFQKIMMKKDSLAAINLKLKQHSIKKASGVEYKQIIIDDSIYPDISIAPSTWSLTMSGEKLISKNVSAERLMQ